MEESHTKSGSGSHLQCLCARGDLLQWDAPGSGTGWDLKHPPKAEITPEPSWLPSPRAGLGLTLHEPLLNFSL